MKAVSNLKYLLAEVKEIFEQIHLSILIKGLIKAL